MERVSDSAAKFEGANIDCPAIPIPGKLIFELNLYFMTVSLAF